jgi:hypothetical protein
MRARGTVNSALIGRGRWYIQLWIQLNDFGYGGLCTNSTGSRMPWISSLGGSCSPVGFGRST